MKTLLALVIIFCVVAPAAIAQQPTKSATASIILAIVPGFGVGHFYAGSDHAVRHLLLDAGAVGVTLLGSIITVSSALSLNVAGAATGSIISTIGALAALGVRIWEIVDIIIETDRLRGEGKVTFNGPQIAVTSAGLYISSSISY